MGNFFTSTQIYNEGMVKSEKFIDMFCKAMKAKNPTFYASLTTANG